MHSNNENPEKLGHQQAPRDNIEGQNPTREGSQNSTDDAVSRISTVEACADLRASEVDRGVLVDRLLTTAARAWLVAVSRLVVLLDEGANDLPETRAPLILRTSAQDTRLEPELLLAWARVLGATILAARTALGWTPVGAVYGEPMVRALAMLPAKTSPTFRHMRNLELLGLGWVERCLQGLQAAVGRFPHLVGEIVYLPPAGSLPDVGYEHTTREERHAQRVLAEVLGPQAPEPLVLVDALLADWELCDAEVMELASRDAELGDEIQEPKTAWQVAWRMGHFAQVVARRLGADWRP